ncbi:MAG: hypothetical protein RIC56_19485 [Pseudomonadales bacterium]
MRSSIFRLFLSATLTLGVLTMSSVARASEPIAQVMGGGGLSVYPKVDGSLSLTVAGPGFWHRMMVESGEGAVFRPDDQHGRPLPDGLYRYEIRVVSAENESASTGQAFALRAPQGGAPGPVQTGTFQIDQGSVSVVRGGGPRQGGSR